MKQNNKYVEQKIISEYELSSKMTKEISIKFQLTMISKKKFSKEKIKTAREESYQIFVLLLFIISSNMKVMFLV